MVPVFDRAGLVNRLGEEELVDLFLSKFRASMSGYLDMLQSELVSGCTEKIQASAHAVKGLAATIGAEQVRQAAVDMEAAAKAGDLPRLGLLLGYMTEACEAFARETVPEATAEAPHLSNKT